MKDKIIIRELEVYYRIGVSAEERAEPQRLLVSVEIDHDFREAAGTDELAATCDYDAICRRLASFGENRQWKLLEKAAADVAEDLKQRFDVDSLTVEIRKFVIPGARYVAVKIQR